MLFSCILLGSIGSNPVKAQERQGDQQPFKEEQIKYNGGELSYRVLYPEGFNKNKEYPVILFLHGAGEREMIIKSSLPMDLIFFWRRLIGKNTQLS